MYLVEEYRVLMIRKQRQLYERYEGLNVYEGVPVLGAVEVAIVYLEAEKAGHGD